MKITSKRFASILLACAVASPTVFACTTAPCPNLATTTAAQVAPQTTKEAPQATKEAFVIDNFKIISTCLEKMGVTPQALEGMIKEGKKLPDVLTEREISIKRFKKALIKEYNTVIRQGVADERLTVEEAKVLRKAIKEKVMCWLKDM